MGDRKYTPCEGGGVHSGMMDTGRGETQGAIKLWFKKSFEGWIAGMPPLCQSLCLEHGDVFFLVQTLQQALGGGGAGTAPHWRDRDLLSDWGPAIAYRNIPGISLSS